ncbi:MAG TPA: sugar ABC transporter permease [Candidatus Methylacidiphilales bacterium]|jgi:multiple sugar transport system permease protein|nr:sugar ABC transporter permease [Candidatus Methylacidiphilales bacterium]
MKPSIRRFLHGIGFTLPWILGLCIFTLYPVVASLYYSFCDYSVLEPAIWIGTDNYRRMLHDGTFWLSLENTLIYAGFSIPLGMVVALSLALLLNCRVRGTAIFRTIFYLPSIVPVIASSMLWLWIFNPSFGLLNWALSPITHLFGANPPGWLADPNWAKPALILMSAWGVGNSMIIYLAGLQDVPEALYEAAEIDGANKWQQFWHVTLPMIMPVVYFNLVMGIIGALQTFTQVFVMTDGVSGAPAQSTLMYAPYLFGTAFFDLRMGYASALAWVLFCIIALLTLLATKALQERISHVR